RGRVEAALQGRPRLREGRARGVVDHQQRSEGGNGLAESRERVRAHRLVEGPHAQVDPGIEDPPELDGERGLPHGEDPRSRRAPPDSGRTDTPADSSARRTAAALATAEGLSPWRHSVSACRETSRPSVAVTRPSVAILTAWAAAWVGSVS